MAAEISTHDSEHRLLQLFDYSRFFFNFKKDETDMLLIWRDNKLGFNGLE
jgi:hypothetical protein